MARRLCRTQIPHIDDRRYPPTLSGPAYPKGLPIFPEHDLESVIANHHVDCCVLAYSDLEHHQVCGLTPKWQAHKRLLHRSCSLQRGARPPAPISSSPSP